MPLEASHNSFISPSAPVFGTAGRAGRGTAGFGRPAGAWRPPCEGTAAGSSAAGRAFASEAALLSAPRARFEPAGVVASATFPCTPTGVGLPPPGRGERSPAGVTRGAVGRSAGSGDTDMHAVRPTNATADKDRRRGRECIRPLSREPRAHRPVHARSTEGLTRSCGSAARGTACPMWVTRSCDPDARRDGRRAFAHLDGAAGDGVPSAPESRGFQSATRTATTRSITDRQWVRWCSRSCASAIRSWWNRRTDRPSPEEVTATWRVVDPYVSRMRSPGR